MNPYRSNPIGTSSSQQVSSHDSDFDSDFVLIDRIDSASPSLANVEVPNVADSAPVVRPEGETPLVHASHATGRQLSQLTQMLKGSNHRLNMRQDRQELPTLSGSNSGSGASNAINAALLSFPQIHEPASFSKSVRFSSSPGRSQQQLADRLASFSPRSTSAAMPLQNATPLSYSTIVRSPSFALRHQPTLHPQRSSFSSRFSSYNSRQADFTRATSSSQVGQLSPTMQLYLSEELDISNQTNQPSQTSRFPSVPMRREEQTRQINNSAGNVSAETHSKSKSAS